MKDGVSLKTGIIPNNQVVPGDINSKSADLKLKSSCCTIFEEVKVKSNSLKVRIFIGHEYSDIELTRRKFL